MSRRTPASCAQSIAGCTSERSAGERVVTHAPIVTLDHSGAVRIRLQRPHAQELQLGLLELPALVAEIVRVLPRDAHGIALIDQIVAAARAHRPRDRTNAERQRRFRQRRRAQRMRAETTGNERPPA